MTVAPVSPKPAPGEWAELANCLGLAPDLFFPARGQDITSAKAVCRDCVVRDDCLAYALTSPTERFGVWGGLSERERRRVRHARQVPA